MLADTSLLLRLYWKIDRRADGGARRKSRLVTILGALFVVGVSGFLGIYASNLTDGTVDIQVREELIPGLLLTVVLFGVVFLGFSQALQALYLSDDLERLLVAPIRPQAVITAKLLSRTPTTILVLLLATIPALVGFGFSVDMGPFYYIFGVLMILVTPLFGIGLGALIAMFMVRLLPARRLNEWVGAASIVIGVLLAMTFYLPGLMGGRKLDPSTLASIEAFINHFGDLPLPSIWAGSALAAFGRSQLTAAAVSALFTYLAITVGLFLVAALLGNTLYMSGWLRMQSAGSTASEIAENPGVFGNRSVNFLLGYKDWVLRIRDPRMLASLFMTVALVALMLFLLLQRSDDGSSLLDLSEEFEGIGFNPIAPGVITSGIIYFAGYLAFSKMALSALSMERSSFYILKTAPVSAGQLFRAKTFSVYLPYTILATVFLLGTMFILKFSFVWTPYGLAVLLIMGYGMLAYLVSLGFRYPKFDWEDPRRMTNRETTLPALAGVFVYSIVGVLLAETTFFFASINPPTAIPIVVLGLSMLAGGTWFFVQWSSNRVEKAWPRISAE